MNQTIQEPSKYLRTDTYREGVSLPIQLDGGNSGNGVIFGASAITRGEALGHEMWIDRVFLNQVANAFNASEKGVKMRFTHPSLSGDGLGKYLGRALNAVIHGDKVLVDAHFSRSAHETPDGDLASYVMQLASEDGNAFGMSIVFTHDPDAEDEFYSENTQVIDGAASFVSPDPLNEGNLPHARLLELHAVDVVDEPAANPEGLFHRENKILQEAEELVSFALGFSDSRPSLSELSSVDPSRARSFVARYLANNNLRLVKEDEMSEAVIEEKEEELSRAEEAQPFIEAFGEEAGAQFFAAGFDMLESYEAYAELLGNRIEELQNKLDASEASAGEDAVEASLHGEVPEKVKTIRLK